MKDDYILEHGCSPVQEIIPRLHYRKTFQKGGLEGRVLEIERWAVLTNRIGSLSLSSVIIPYHRVALLGSPGRIIDDRERGEYEEEHA